MNAPELGMRALGREFDSRTPRPTGTLWQDAPRPPRTYNVTWCRMFGSFVQQDNKTRAPCYSYSRVSNGRVARALRSPPALPFVREGRPS